MPVPLPPCRDKLYKDENLDDTPVDECKVDWKDFCVDPWTQAEELHNRGCAKRSKSYLYFHMMDQYHCFRTASGTWAVDFIGRVEHTNEDWAQVSEHQGSGCWHTQLEASLTPCRWSEWLLRKVVIYSCTCPSRFADGLEAQPAPLHGFHMRTVLKRSHHLLAGLANLSAFIRFGCMRPNFAWL